MMERTATAPSRTTACGRILETARMPVSPGLMMAVNA